MADSKTDTILICGAWPYVNGEIHIGHLPGYFVPGDILARYFRLKGYDTLFVSGTDCHGTPITIEADKRKITPSELVKEYEPKIKNIISLYKFSYDNFTTTRTSTHKEVVQTLFLDLLKNGYITKKKSNQYFSKSENRFLPDRYVEGICTYCDSSEQRADQCEKCGRTIGMGELLNPKSKLSGEDVSLKLTEHYFFNLNELESKIKPFINSNKDFWRNWVLEESLGWLEEGLQPRAITRDIDWGIEIPTDKIPDEMRLENYEGKRFYVWFDAVIGYLSATIEYCKLNNTDYSKYWFNKNSRHFYVMGQDNLMFHTIFWPAQLIGTDKGYTLPRIPSVVKFLNANGQKLSKSRGNIISAEKLAINTEPDFVRFYITKIMPENKESNWDWEHFKNTVNSELIDNIGNFINRTLSFSFKYKEILNLDEVNETDDLIANESIKIFHTVSELIEKNNFKSALDEIIAYSTLGNKYFDQQKPWATIKTDIEKTKLIIRSVFQIVRDLRILLTPFIPTLISRIDNIVEFDDFKNVIGVDKFSHKSVSNLRIEFKSQPSPLFLKIESEDINKLSTDNSVTN